ncbi:PQQ-binding-like beta-propeller repeat protein, partial [Planctomycetota bacterium]
ASDWPQYRYDANRSGVTTEQLPPQLHLAWTYKSTHPPKPAWPEPGRELHVMTFDYAFNVVVGNGLVYFGSSADHKVYALDLATGQEKWSFFAEGPIRFSPVLYKGRVFVASDDGYLYCLSAKDGSLLWKYLAAPKKRRVFGNGQMISRWPIRTGLAIDDGLIYFAAGMWPSEGVYLYAVSADTGKVLWKNTQRAEKYKPQPHPGAYSFVGVAPQGYIVLGKERIYIPTGRNVPAGFNKANGKFLYYHSAPPKWSDRWGGSWNFYAGGLLFGGLNTPVKDQNIKLGECKPNENYGIISFNPETGAGIKHKPIGGKLRAVINNNILYASGTGSVTAYDFKGWQEGKSLGECKKWSVSQGRTYCLIMAGNTLYAGGKESVTAITDKGKKLWDRKVNGQVRNLAVADGHLIASTTTGEISCFGKKAGHVEIVSPGEVKVDEPKDKEAEKQARKVFEYTGIKEGYCLVVGPCKQNFLYYLAKKSNLIIYYVEPDEINAASMRIFLNNHKLYGNRVSVHHGSINGMGYPKFFANLLVIPEKACEKPGKQIWGISRTLRPWGGKACFLAGKYASETFGFLRDAIFPQDNFKLTGSVIEITREKLAYTDNWTHQYANAGKTGASSDKLIKVPVEVLWFGKPGPSKLVSRHWKGPSPLVVNGRMFIAGQFNVMAVDAYNGRQLWERKFPHAGRHPVSSRGSNFAADDKSVFLAVKNECIRLDGVTGKTLKKYHLPDFPNMVKYEEEVLWGYLGIHSDFVLGSAGRLQYSRALFALDKSEGKLKWEYIAQKEFPHTSVIFDTERVYLIDRISHKAADVLKRRGESDKIPTPKLTCLNTKTGKKLWETQEDMKGKYWLCLSQKKLLAGGGKGKVTAFKADTGTKLYTASSVRRSPVIVGDKVYTDPGAFDLDTGRPITKNCPLSQEYKPWEMGRSYGCGTIAGSTHLLSFRSGTIGMYDLLGQTGVHNFSGVRAGCWINAIPANGLLLAPPGDASCSCRYNFQTTVALISASEKPGFGLRYSRLPAGYIKEIAINLGAPGDHRGEDGKMWVCLPRPGTSKDRKGLETPYRFEYLKSPESGAYNSQDSLAGKVKDLGLYSTGIKGLKRMEFDLYLLYEGVPLWQTASQPNVDGKLEEDTWQKYQAIPIPEENAEVMLRSDANNFYVGYSRKLNDESTGKEAFDVILSSVPSKDQYARGYLRLGISASGKPRVGFWKYETEFPIFDIPKIEVTIDGQIDDWKDKGFKMMSLPVEGAMLPSEDYDPSCTLGWNDEGLLVLAQIKDDVIEEDTRNDRLWAKDGIELFMSTELGSNEKYQLVITPGITTEAKELQSHFYDSRKKNKKVKLSFKGASSKTEDGYVVEVLLPWKNLNIDPKPDSIIPFQLYTNDTDNEKGELQVNCGLHPGQHPKYSGSYGYQRFRLSYKASPEICFKRSDQPRKDGRFGVKMPAPYPLKSKPLGAKGEDSGYPAKWSVAALIKDKNFTTEIAVPWDTIKNAGIEKKNIMVDITTRGHLKEAPKSGGRFIPLTGIRSSVVKKKNLTVRLYFIEVENVKPGERVFDVKLQGKTVLKDFDIGKEAGGPMKALVKEFKGVEVTKGLVVELIPKQGTPVICGIEIVQ